MRAFLCLVFMLSGAAGLVYESIWTRYLGLFVGHSAYAQVLVLVIFLGGMSVGALAVGRRAEQVRDPLRWYAGIELATGLIGFVFHDVFRWTTHLAYDSIFPALGPGALHVIVKWSLAALLILPQSVLLGATFPLMSAGVIRRMPRESGSTISLLYFANSLGASGGVLLAGFVLIQAVGLPGTLLAAALANVVAAAAVYVAAKQPATAHTDGSDDAARADGVTPAERNVAPALYRLLLAVSFGTAVSSFIYEIGWIRMLSLVLGAATHSFELMLSGFILGLAIGAFIIRRRTGGDASALHRLARVQIAMGLLAVLTLPIYMKSFTWMAGFMAAFTRTPAGYVGFSVARYAICLAVMLPATICAGMTLPLITRLLMRGADGERALGRVYGVNTLGSIIGVGLAALVLLPLLGLKLMIVAGAAIDIGLGAWLVAHDARRGGARLQLARFAPALGAALVVLLVSAMTRFDRDVLASGVFRYGTVSVPARTHIAFFKDGRTATVSVRRIQASNGLSLATNGKPDASLGPEWFVPPATPTRFTHDASTQVLLPIVALAHVPQARVAAIIGQGSGMSSSTLLGDPRLSRVVTIEIEPQMIRASRSFYPANARVFDDSRSHFAIDDARSYFAAQGERYDLIISEPSNPWVAGVSGLFTTEFYAHVKRFMAPRAIFAQWIHLSEINDGLVLSVVRAIAGNFPDYAMYVVGNHDVLIVATNERTLPAPDWSVLQLPGIANDMKRVLTLTPQMLDALRVVTASTLSPLVEGGGGNSDFYPVLDLGAERTRFLTEGATGFIGLSGERFGVATLLEPRRAPVSTSPYNVIGDVPRLEAMELAARVGSSSFAGATNEQLIAAENVRAVDRTIASGAAPVEWRYWVETVRRAEETRAGGSAGVADSAWFARIAQYLARTAAPAEAKASIAFLHGLASWDFAETARASTTLMDAASRGDFWLSPDLLREGTVVARLRTGDIPGARSAWVRLAPVSSRSPDDVRPQLLAAWIIAAAGEKSAP
jgi:spermidine synthase